MWEEMSYYRLDNNRTMQERLRDEAEPETGLAEFFQDITYTLGYWLGVDSTVDIVETKGD
jgi:hypothetical protein